MTTSATAGALARILGHRIDRLESAVREAIAALEADAETRPTDPEIADKLREAL